MGDNTINCMLAQINTTPNDFLGNVDQIKEHIVAAGKSNCDLVVFPELSIPGYSVKDMVYSEEFIYKNQDALNELMAFSKNTPALHIFVGYVEKTNKGSGKPYYNSVAIIKNGIVVGRYHKWLLPFTDVFDEPRWFEPGTETCVISIKGLRFGVAICEDLWNDKYQDDYSHHHNPIQSYRDIGIDWLISVNSSPYIKGKPKHRHHMISEIARHSFGVVYVNQIGGQDELIFDGNSFAITNSGEAIACLRNEGADAKTLVQGKNQVFQLHPEPSSYEHIVKVRSDFQHVGERNEILQMVLMGLYDYGTKSGFKNFVTGSSGGIDSAVILALAEMAFGPDAVHGIRMPSLFSSHGSVNDALQLHTNIKIHDYLVPIEHVSVIDHFNTSLGLDKSDNYNKVADENIQARIRGQCVMHFSNAKGALALTTTNKTENALGYGTLFGDLAGTLNPIGDLYKQEVYEIAALINSIKKFEAIPLNIINKAPSAELAPGQTDEAALMPYVILDRIVEAYVEFYIRTKSEFKEWLKVHNEVAYTALIVNHNDIFEARYDQMIRRIDAMEFKRRQTAPCFKVSRKAFGSGRRLPIVKK